MAKSFDELEVTLRAIWNERPSPDAPPPRARVRQIKALLATASFFESNGIDSSVVLEFRMMATALRGLDAGIVAPFLKPSKQENRTRDCTEIWLARAFVAIAIDVLVSSKKTQRASSEFIAEVTKRWNSIFDGDFCEIARKWYRDFASRRVKSREAQHTFDTRAEMVDAERRDLVAAGLEPTPEKVAQMILEYARVYAVKARGINDLKQLGGLG